jgi:hypothetical protein
MLDNTEAIEYYKAVKLLNSDFDAEVAFINGIKSKYSINEIGLIDTILEKIDSNRDCFVYKYRDQNFRNLPFSKHSTYRHKYIAECISKSKEIYDLIHDS